MAIHRVLVGVFGSISRMSVLIGPMLPVDNFCVYVDNYLWISLLPVDNY